MKYKYLFSLLTFLFPVHIKGLSLEITPLIMGTFSNNLTHFMTGTFSDKPVHCYGITLGLQATLDIFDFYKEDGLNISPLGTVMVMGLPDNNRINGFVGPGTRFSINSDKFFINLDIFAGIFMNQDFSVNYEYIKNEKNKRYLEYLLNNNSHFISDHSVSDKNVEYIKKNNLSALEAKKYIIDEFENQKKQLLQSLILVLKFQLVYKLALVLDLAK